MADQHELDNKLVSIEQAIDRQIRRANSMKNTTLIVGVILILVVAGYLLWAGYWVREIMQPRELAGMASTQVVTFIREYRPTAEQEARANAGPLVNRLMDEVLETQLPAGRRYLETYARTESKKALDNMSEYLIETLGESLEANRMQIADMVDNLQTPDGAMEFKDQITAIIDESLADEEITVQLDEYAYALRDIEGTLTRISTGEGDLTSSERATYDLLAVVLEFAERNITGFDFLGVPSFEGIEEIIAEEAPPL